MIIALSFIGKLPSYIVDCIHQIRLFFNGDIYLILDDVSSFYLIELQKYNIKTVEYSKVMSNEFIQSYHRNKDKFVVLPTLVGREFLFIRSFERFFLLQNAMKQLNLSDVLFMELDNLIYDDPNSWLPEFSKNELCYMFDNNDRCSSGIMYVKNKNSMDNLLNYTLNYFNNYNETDWMNEMTLLCRFQQKFPSEVQLLPTFWKSDEYKDSCINYGNYNNTIFDAAAIGIFLTGTDPLTNNGNIDIGHKWKWSMIDYTKYKYEWKTDDLGRKSPYIWDGSSWIKINNLHIHSKQLYMGVSKQK